MQSRTGHDAKGVSGIEAREQQQSRSSMLLCQVFDLYQIQLTFLAPSLLTRGYIGAELLIQVVAMLANFFGLVAVGKRLKRSLGVLQQHRVCKSSLACGAKVNSTQNNLREAHVVLIPALEVYTELETLARRRTNA